MPKKGGARKRATLKYDREWYLPHTAKANLPEHEQQIREEYSRLRSIARKRLERIRGTEWENTDIYRQNAGKFKPLSEIKSSELPGYLDAVSRFVIAKRSSVTGLTQYRSATVETLRKRGFTFVTEENYNDLVKFLEAVRIANLNILFDSKRLAEFWNDMREVGVAMKEGEFKKAFRKFIKHEFKEQKKRGVKISSKVMGEAIKNVDELF